MQNLIVQTSVPDWVIKKARKRGRVFVRQVITVNNNETTVKWQSLSKRGWKDTFPPIPASQTNGKL